MTTVLSNEVCQAAPFKRKPFVRRVLDQILYVEPVRKLYLRCRFFWYARILGRMRTYDTHSEAVAKETIQHNLRGIGDVAVVRSDAIVKPLSVIESLPLDARILCIGPRAEGELYNLAAHGFLLANIEGLDLISYSPHIQLGDMHSMSYADGSWDAIVAGWVLAYSDDKRQAAAEMIRVCKAGGVIGVGVEFNPLSPGDIRQAIGYIPGSSEVVRSVESLLALFAPHVDRVYFAHEPTEARRDRKGSVVAVFSIKK